MNWSRSLSSVLAIWVGGCFAEEEGEQGAGEEQMASLEQLVTDVVYYISKDYGRAWFLQEFVCTVECFDGTEVGYELTVYGQIAFGNSCVDPDLEGVTYGTWSDFCDPEVNGAAIRVSCEGTDPTDPTKPCTFSAGLPITDGWSALQGLSGGVSFPQGPLSGPIQRALESMKAWP